jgi:hypothetical protein
MRKALIFIFIVLAFKCQDISSQNGIDANKNGPLINPDSHTISARFNLPPNYSRMNLNPHSFAFYLSHLPLEDVNAKVVFYNKEEKVYQGFCAAVVKMDIGIRDLQQCADAVIRLRAEYLYHQEKYKQIHFNLTNGFKTNFWDWANGSRIKVIGDICIVDMAKAKTDFSYKNFRKYLDFVFTYAGSLSLSKELQAVKLQSLEIGDVFIKGGSPGHAIIVVDVAIEKNSGNKIFLLAQSYMPAQSIHIVVNPNNSNISPWYSLDEIKTELYTNEWTFTKDELKRFQVE